MHFQRDMFSLGDRDHFEKRNADLEMETYSALYKRVKFSDDNERIRYDSVNPDQGLDHEKSPP